MSKISANVIGAIILGLIVSTIVVPFKVAAIVPAIYMENKKYNAR